MPNVVSIHDDTHLEGFRGSPRSGTVGVFLTDPSIAAHWGAKNELMKVERFRMRGAIGCTWAGACLWGRRRVNRTLLMVVLSGVALAGHAATPGTVSTLAGVAALSNEQASHSVPAEFNGTVVYSRGAEKLQFVQDGNAAVFVEASGSVSARRSRPGEGTDAKQLPAHRGCGQHEAAVPRCPAEPIAGNICGDDHGRARLPAG